MNMLIYRGVPALVGRYGGHPSTVFLIGGGKIIFSLKMGSASHYVCPLEI